MRLLPAAALAGLLAASSAASAMAQSLLGAPDNGSSDNTVIAVPPAPPIVASPASPITPAIPAMPPPPGLVPVNPPDDGGNADNGSTAVQSPPLPPMPGTPGPGTPGPGTPAAGQPGSAPGPGDAAQNQPPEQDVIPTPPNIWQPGKTAEIGVLDKVNGGVTDISVPVGGQSVIGDLQVNVLACVTRPPDQVPDAAVFLALQNTGDAAAPPNYRGWLLRSQPGAAVAGDASEIFRIINCS